MRKNQESTYPSRGDLQGSVNMYLPLRTRFITATGVAKGRVSEQAATNIYIYVHNRVKAWLWSN
jgi:hypothetical protein